MSLSVISVEGAQEALTDMPPRAEEVRFHLEVLLLYYCIDCVHRSWIQSLSTTKPS